MGNSHRADGLDAEKVDHLRRTEATNGWPLLRRCPNTAAASRLAFLDELPGPEQVRFADELSAFESGTRSDETMNDWTSRASSFPLVARYLDDAAQSRRRGIGAVPVKIIAGVRNDEVVGGLDGWIRQVGLTAHQALPPPWLANSLDELVPAPPRTIRRLVTRLMRERFEASAVKLGASDERFDLGIDGTPVRVTLMFAPSGGRSIHQLDYALQFPGRPGAPSTLEQLWRTPGRWDYMTESNVERSVDHLGDIITAVAGLT